MENEIWRLEQQGVIEQVQFSDWAAPIVAALKKGSELRVCGDNSLTVNPVIVPDSYPLPRIDDLLASLAGGESFTKLDLSSAYQQVELDEESKKLLTVNTPWGLFRYNRLPFGVSVAPAIFQRTNHGQFAARRTGNRRVSR